MSYWQDLEEYTEPSYGAISVNHNPVAHSCDNTLSFTSEAFLYSPLGEPPIDRINALKNLVFWCVQDDGIVRYPNTKDYTAFDDCLTMAACFHWMEMDIEAKVLHKVLSKNRWMNGGNLLWRHLHMVALVKYAANKRWEWWFTPVFMLCFLAGYAEKLGETSGKRHLWHIAMVVQGQSKVLDTIINGWKEWIKSTYPEGFKTVLGIYFSGEHPFTRYFKC